MITSEVSHAPDHNLNVYKEERQDSKYKVVSILVLLALFMTFTIIGLFYFFSNINSKINSKPEDTKVYISFDEQNNIEILAPSYDSPEEVISILPDRYTPFPTKYIPYLHFVDKTQGDSYRGNGIFYYNDIDNKDGMLVRGVVKDWGETTVRLELTDRANGNASLVDLLVPQSGVVEYLDGEPSTIVSDERKSYYIDKLVVVPIELIGDNFTVISFTELDGNLY